MSLRYELLERGLLLFFFAQPQQRRRMKGGEDMGRERAVDELPALHGDLEMRADHGLRGGGAERDDDVRLHGLHFALQPLVAGVDLALRRRLVQAPLAARLPLEVLDRVGDV